MYRYKITFAYDGTNFSGFQIQPHKRTVEQVLKNAVNKIAKHPTPAISVIGSGRTDAGVHALNQVAHFDIPYHLSNDSMLSPYKFYQFWLNQPDDQVVKLLKAFTFLPKARIEELAQGVKEDPGAREAQKVLAAEVTGFVHGQKAVDEAVSASAALFGRGGDLADLSAGTLEAALEGLRNVHQEDGTLAFAKGEAGEGVARAAKDAGLFPSVSRAMKAIAQGGVYINNKRVAETSATLRDEDFLGGRFVVLRRGKKALGALEATK